MRKYLMSIVLIGLISKCFAQTYHVGAKHFNEGHILGEMLALLLEEDGYTVERVFNLGGTKICYEALRKGDIDVYPEYTGSLIKEILQSEKNLTSSELNTHLQHTLGLEITHPFGFNNTYALATTRQTATQYNLTTISDLKDIPVLTTAFSHEFLNRRDGWLSLRNAYRLTLNPAGIEHGLAYQALEEGKIELTDAYSTDGEIKKYELTLLEDDLQFFPEYQAVALFSASLDSAAKAVFAKLNGCINNKEMQEINASVLFEQKSTIEAARDFLASKNLIRMKEKPIAPSWWGEIWDKSITHLAITTSAVGLAIAGAFLLGILLYFFSSLSKPVLYLAGLLQTIPSIALLALMIPLLGIGRIPAIVALFLYALLPILRNMMTGLTTIDITLNKVANGMGMTSFQRLVYVALPLAMPYILAGIRTASVITIGTATLAAFIGAGGLGEFIVTGLALNNTTLILQGAIPAALLAIAVELIFEGLEKILIPKHLRM